MPAKAELGRRMGQFSMIKEWSKTGLVCINQEAIVSEMLKAGKSTELV